MWPVVLLVDNQGRKHVTRGSQSVTGEFRGRLSYPRPHLYLKDRTRCDLTMSSSVILYSICVCVGAWDSYRRVGHWHNHWAVRLPRRVWARASEICQIISLSRLSTKEHIRLRSPGSGLDDLKQGHGQNLKRQSSWIFGLLLFHLLSVFPTGRIFGRQLKRGR
jgi:hypothetical protein